MTSVVANKIGLDIVDIQVSQTGSAETDMFFQEPVLDRKKDYVVGVSELSVPLNDETPLSKTEQNMKDSFIRLKRKTGPGAGFAPLVTTAPATEVFSENAQGVITNGWARFRLYKRNIVSPVDLFRHLHEWFDTVRNTIDALGTVNANLFPLGECYFSISPSGVISVSGEPAFWRHYYFQLSDYGREILGYYQNYISFVYHQTNAGQTIKSWDWFQQFGAVGGNNVFLAVNHPNNVQVQMSRFDNSMYRYIDHRLRIELDADLAIPANILVENGNQKMHYNIASFAMPHQYEGRINVVNQYVDSSISHVAHMYVGNTVIKKKESATTDWYKLVSAANVQNMRLHVFVVRRDYNPKTKTWGLTRNKLQLQEDQTWFATMKFIQQF